MNKPLFIEIKAGVRYWEDASVNGVDDINGDLIPLRDGDSWDVVIDLKDGSVQEWPFGINADIHFKVCDAGEYWLLYENKKRVAKWNGFYVPDDFLSQGGHGYGDYIIMKINSNGFVDNWIKPPIYIAKDSEDQNGWIEI